MSTNIEYKYLALCEDMFNGDFAKNNIKIQYISYDSNDLIDIFEGDLPSNAVSLNFNNIGALNTFLKKEKIVWFPHYVRKLWYLI